jgi:serine/threonine protein kinase
VFQGEGYTGYQSDVWSAGVVLYTMLYGTVPFKANNISELQKQITKK